MPTSGLIVLAPITPGREAQLRQALNAVGNDVNGRRMAAPRPHLDFPGSRTVHFARLAVCDDPDRGPGRQRLLLATDFDGGWEAHVNELWRITSDPDAIWGCCEGYEGDASFARFIREREVRPEVHYIAYPDRSVEDIRSGARMRQQLEAWLHTPEAHALARSVGRLDPASLASQAAHAVEGIAGVASQTAVDAARMAAAGVDVLGVMARLGPLNTLGAARRVNATIDRVPWIRAFNLLTLNSAPAPKHRYSTAPMDTSADCIPAEPGDEVVTRPAWSDVPGEDLVSQNQLTLITVVRQGEVQRLRAVLAVIDLYSRRLTEPGSLVGISTIHTVRWALIDGGRRFLMLSNYDGTWESYIDEFAELILSGLNALWDTSLGFPEAGAQDVAALKHFLRCHQVPANVFYSAYPATTVININDNDRALKHLRRRLADLADGAPHT